MVIRHSVKELLAKITIVIVSSNKAQKLIFVEMEPAISHVAVIVISVHIKLQKIK